MRLTLTGSTLAAMAASILLAGCAGSGPADPTIAENATLSGVVMAATGAVIDGAEVAVGSVTTKTGADGQFELQKLRVGSARILISAPRFDEQAVNVTLNAGANVHNVVLTRRTLFTHQDVVVYLPPGKAEYRAAIVFLPGLRDPVTGNPLDSRRLVSGAASTGCSIWCPASELETVRRRSLELAGGNVALVGTTTLVDSPLDYDKLLFALSDVATQSLHPELASIPILFVGHSQGGCTAYGFSRVHPARTVGFITMKGGCHNPGPAGAATTVPGFFLIGQFDLPHRTANITPVFEGGRAADAPWSLSTDAFEHGPILDFDLMFDWMDAVLAMRLPEAPGSPLRTVSLTGGWLGDRSTGWIHPYGCYGADRSRASWLPSRKAAMGWQRMAGGNVVVDGC